MADARTPDEAAGEAPARAGLVLISLILVAVLLGAALVFRTVFPKMAGEQRLLEQYRAEDAAPREPAPEPDPGPMPAPAGY